MDGINVIVSNSHVNNKLELHELGLINFLQDIEGIHIASLKQFNKHLNDNNFGVFLTYRQIDILKKIKFGDKLYLTTYPFNTTPISGYRHIYIKDILGNDLVKTTGFGVFVNVENNQIVRIPKEIIKTINDQEFDPTIEILPRKIEVDSTIEKLLGSIKIRKSHIDRYNHVNNAHYLSFAIDLYEKDFKYDRIRIEYLNSFKLNQECYVYLSEENNNKITFRLKDNESKVYSIIEFSNK